MRVMITLFISLYLFFSPIWTQTQKAKFDGQTMLEYIKVLADDSMEGRRSGLPGGKKAALYILNKLKEWGIEPAGNNHTYRQQFNLEDFFNVEPGASLEIIAAKEKMRSFAFNQDFLNDEWTVCKYSGSGNVESEIVFAGYGIHAPDKGYDDYSGVDVKDKVALISIGVPGKLIAKLGKAASHDQRIKAAQTMGARGVIACPPAAPIGRGLPYPARMDLKKEIYRPDFFVVGVNTKVVNYIFNYLHAEMRDFFSEIDKSSKPHSFQTGIKARISVKTSLDEARQTFNVLGKVSGKDPQLKNEYVVLSAHMDHLGISPLNEVFNGANDNASGTAVVMEVARLMKKHEIKPKRTVLFALWAAEEQGLLGSEHYVNHPLYPLEKTVANINLDCVGQGTDKVDLGGIYLSADTWNVVKSKIDPMALEGMNPRRGVGGSDHLSFLEKGVPAFHMVTGFPVYKLHHPRDDWDLIKPDVLEKSARFLYDAAIRLANIEENLLFSDRAEKIFFKRDNMINYCLLSSEYVLENFKNVENALVDLQLIYPEVKGKANPSEIKLEILDYLNGLPGKVEKAPGLALYGEDRMAFIRRRARRTQLLVGLKGSSSFKDKPSWLDIYSKLGVQYTMLDAADLGFEEDVLTSSGKELVQAVSKAKILLIVSGLSGRQYKEVLSASRKPLVIVSGDVPPQDILDLMKRRGHVLGMKFNPGETALEYFARLSRAKESLGLDHLIAWNEPSLWKDEIQENYLKLFSLFIKEGWTKEERGRPVLSKVTSGTFLNLLRIAKR